MLKQIALIILAFSFSFNFFSQGIRFDKERFESSERWEQEDLGFSAVLPTNFSLRKYCPPSLSQEGQSCVGWASAYGAMSIIHNIKFNITNDNEKFLFAFDPNYIYSLIALESDYNCEQGTYITDGLSILTKYGCKKMFAPELTSCNSVISKKSKKYGLPFVIKGYQTPPDEFYDGTAEEKITLLKESLIEKNPLIIAIATTETFSTFGSDIGIVGKDGLYDPNENENFNGGHAMCVIGYDENKFGGSFEVMNSWGTDFGDNGFVWIKFDDFLRITREIYKLDVFENNINKSSTYECFFGDCKNEYSHSKFEDNHRYEGEFKNGNLKGFGLYYFDNGDLYAGQFSMGTQHGSGIYYISQEDKWYYTYFRNGEITDSESLGFVNIEKTVEELEIEKFFKQQQESGYINSKIHENISDFNPEVINKKNED